MPRVVVEQTLRYDASLTRLWPLLSNSSLLAELDGRPAYEAVDELQPDGSVIRRAKGEFGPSVAAEWTEDLGEWVFHRYVRQFRQFTKGAFLSVDYQVAVTTFDGGFNLNIRIDMVTRGLIGWIGRYLGLIRRAGENFNGTLDRVLRAELAAPAADDETMILAAAFDPKPLSSQVQTRMNQALAAIADERGDSPTLPLLAEYLGGAPETWLLRIRPMVLARKWRADAGEVVSICLAAHHHGLLRLRWEVLCPRCRNASDVPDNLADLPKSVHCTTCNIDFEQDFSANVELIFQPEPWLRPLPDGAFCMMGAPSVPHVKVQRNVNPGETLAIDPPLEAGSYRLRTAQAGDQIDVNWDGQTGFPTVIAQGDTVAAGPPSPPGQILLDNRTDRALTFVIEELAWRKDALTGDRAIVMPAFQQYCPEQILRPGDDVAIANVVLLFTDLKGSTSMYEALGDAAAYNLVRDHFDYLTNLVERHGGVLVKTIGDAVMAAFAEPDEGVRAALEAQLGIGEFNRGRVDGGIVLKVGLHQGPCIAVTTSGQLDYFGSTVNVAARVQGESAGGDILFSDDLMSATGVREALVEAGAGMPSEETADLRGVALPVRLWRLQMSEQF
ncbi:MAG: adenylate/guanylate cyclase domain-containing protein [Rhodospirillaceae bacterium]|jgi:class 3 adenylate cyclase|nr:adenylate/guanylate cyclase domain-containing protein [Rhodospirillaceae bacterium]MBT5193078.1 adenylate/guanylate cyclase domain-containing protein [Rhodospirillaceae bacterium]MBT5898686.1 adenylate/guanylate cyclase domain-containing protein [Rhodospirillaceae bacterium]MBT6427163.1 adenylate/guanylate cyclase domain-containing protein [Rhodospirillaceae bacterium]MBT7756229.1 adenylate/guanylate cyclase domain-containing protein [Rhodospirillaceae bacterium]